MSKTLFISRGSYQSAGAVSGRRTGLARGALLAVGVLIGAAAVAGLPRVAAADPGVLDGSWSGSGTVTYSSGAKEAARCKATYKNTGGASYAVNAVCASASGRVAQVATVSRSGDGYSGSFYNKEYGIDGSIQIKVQGNSQSVTLYGGGGTAVFRLSR